MSKLRVDAEHRILLPGSQPGEVFDVERRPDGGYVLARLDAFAPKQLRTEDEVRRAMEESPLNLTMTWEELRKITREL